MENRLKAIAELEARISSVRKDAEEAISAKAAAQDPS